LHSLSSSFVCTFTYFSISLPVAWLMWIYFFVTLRFFLQWGSDTSEDLAHHQIG
jgi:hypothetical protein